MRVIKQYNQHAYDCTIDIECESCKNVEIGRSAYDDRNMWNNVVPEWKCKQCGESTSSMRAKAQEK